MADHEPTPPTEEPPGTFLVELTRDGSTIVDGEVIAPGEDLFAAIQRAMARRKQRRKEQTPVP